MKNGIIICGAAPCMEEDLSRIPNPEAWDFLAVGMDAIARVPYPLRFLATFHPDDIAISRVRRKAAGGNLDYKVIGHRSQDNIDIVVNERNMAVTFSGANSGSSALLGTLACVKLGYERIILCGCPLENEERGGKIKEYENYRKGWQKHLDLYVGKVKSMSGWTMQFLGPPPEEWLKP